MKQKFIMAGIVYVIGITIIGICDTLNDGVEKRAKAQDIRSERLEKRQEELEKKVAERQQRTEDYLRKRYAQ